VPRGERKRGVGVNKGAVVVDFAAEVDGVAGRGEVELHALEGELGRGLSVEFGADGAPFSGEAHGRQKTEDRRQKTEDRGRRTGIRILRRKRGGIFWRGRRVF
jgi:hypothetical protein